MDNGWTCLALIGAVFFVTVTSDCGKNGCGGGGGGGGAGGNFGGLGRGFGSYSTFSRSSNYNAGPRRMYNTYQNAPVRTETHSVERSGPGWQASYRQNADGSWSRQSSWNSNAGYSSSKAALSGFHTRGGAGGAGGMVHEVVRTGGGGGRGSANRITGARGAGGSYVTRTNAGGGTVTRTNGGGGGGRASVTRTNGGGGSVTRTNGGGGSVTRTNGGGGGGGRKVVQEVVRTRVGGGGQRRGGGGGVARVVNTCSDAGRINYPITGFQNQMVTVTSCSDIVRDYPSLCSMMGSIGGDCCSSCRSIGRPNCLDQLSEANAIAFANGLRLTSCSQISGRYQGLCATYGGSGNLCCHTCQDVTVEEITDNNKGETGETRGHEEAVIVDVDVDAKGPAPGPQVEVGVSGGQVNVGTNPDDKGPSASTGRGDATQAKGPVDESRQRETVVQPKGPTDASQGQVDEVQLKGPGTAETRRRVDQVVRTKGPTDEVRRRTDELQTKGPADVAGTRRREERLWTKGQTAESRQRTSQMDKGPSAAAGQQDQVNACVDRELGRMQSKGSGITCQQFIARDPCNCQEVAEECCASCARVDLNQADCTCRDTLSKSHPYYVFASVRNDNLEDKAGTAASQRRTNTITINSCRELVQGRFSSFCSQIGGPGQSCCRSCRAADITRPAQTCTDRLSPDFPIILSNNGTIDDCRILRRDYAQFCGDYGGQGGDCCHSCQGVDLSCVDEALRWWRVNNGRMMGCREYVHADPCNCQKVASHCCQSCRNVDLTQCQCRDTLSSETPYVVRNVNVKGDVTKQNVTSCYQIARDFPEACARLGGEGRACCRTCSQVDKANVTCKDTLSSTHSITLGTGVSAYSCQQLVETNLTLCGRPFIGQDNGTCCLTCRHGFNESDSCEDDSHKRWFKSGVGYTCKDWVKADPCNCKRCHRECCQSCKSADSCVDRLPTAVAQALGVDTCPKLVKKYPEMCVDVAGACCASCRNQKRVQNVNTVTQQKTHIGHNIVKQAVGGQDGSDLFEFKGPVMEMKSDVLDAAMENLAKEIQGSVNFEYTKNHGADDMIHRKVTFVNEHGPVEMGYEVNPDQPKVVEWEEEYVNLGPEEVSGTEDEVIGVINPGGGEEEVVYGEVVDTKGPGGPSLVEYYDYDYGGSKGDRETVVVVEEEDNRGSGAGACVDRELGTMQSKGPGITCQDFVARDPCHCQEVKKECCASCAGVVLTPERCSCRDLLSSVYPYYVYPNGLNALDAEETKLKFTSCFDLISRYPNFCDELGKAGQSCCKMCRRAHIEPNCMDKLSAQYPLYLNGKPVDDCRLLARDYKDQCKDYGGQGQACCRSCQNVGDLSCVDDSLMYWQLDGVKYNCRDYVHLDPCRCLHVRNHCCDSCKHADMRRCNCRDTLSATNHYLVTHYKPDGSTDYVEKVNSCSIITRDYPQFCRELGGPRNTCCRACLDLSHLQSKGPSG